ncbi:hypothetical protein BGZ65_005991 [Modicella reniformis]|uniref:Uncharacterized protein n=1 Tax=Modicella reniformis TaxID=1440133 RepID=A0A9P6JNH2_9FUNG|nr:hypothetical protein BGZ65_005991 [Modicella reniformis]
MQIGDFYADIKKITDRFFAPGPIASFLDAFVRGKGTLPVTNGLIRGLPRAWRRNMGEAPQTRPSLLFLDLPDPAVPDLATKNFTRLWQTRAVIELLSQHWGFYFNASSDDWGSHDVMALFDTVRIHLKDIQASSTKGDLEANNAFARKTTLLLFLSRLLVFKYCLSVPGSGETFTSARWTLLQVCPHVLFQDIFGELFVKLLELRHHRGLDLSDVVRNVYDGAKGRLVEHGCLPKIKDNTRLLVINDEAQFLGDQFKGSFKSASDSDDSLRPLLSPILHAFRQVGQHQLTLVTCGTGLSINTLFWVQSSGSGLKDSSTNFEKATPMCFWTEVPLSLTDGTCPRKKFSVDRIMFDQEGKALSYGDKDQLFHRTIEQRVRYLDQLNEGWEDGIQWADRAIEKLRGYNVETEKYRPWTTVRERSWRCFVKQKDMRGKLDRVQWSKEE